jgi:hypothetical protein
MSNITINGGPGLAIYAYNQTQNRSQFQDENINSNTTEGQLSNGTRRVPPGRSTLQGSSTSDANLQRNLVSQSEGSLVCAYNSAICDFAIVPNRTATQTASGGWEATGANSATSQTPPTAAAQTLALSVSTALPSVTTPVTTYPNPGSPFRVGITGSDAFSFGGSEVATKEAKTKNAQSAAGVAQSINLSLSRNNSIGMDGRIALTDAAGNPLNPANPSAAPGYNAATNTAPGNSSFVLYSGRITAPTLFIPGPVPGDTNPLVPGPTNNNITTNIQNQASAGNALQQSRARQGQFKNQISISRQGQFETSTTQFMSITRP